MRETHFQHEFKVNIWCGVICGYLIGPFELPTNLNGPLYLDFLQERLHELLEDIPLALRQNMQFLHDGAPPHYSLQVRQYLKEQFPHWPPRGPDLNPLDFSIWSQMKALVYKEKITSLPQLRRKIEEAADVIKNNTQGLFDIKRSDHKVY
ncbi:uncharacterized protein LOC130448740 [Diorhabda sublineata]|uniref:uncharacterized protein LOC130448740 n=1 Tax=Diorhabda sublineata TaxID=1163346 RepID=UPI0024E06791|nr:uncharacterized protein LOC130448740 [Diorhabda sublineata]